MIVLRINEGRLSQLFCAMLYTALVHSDGYN